jgi:hypothetical protein
MRQLIAAAIATLLLAVCGYADAQHTGGSVGASSWRSSSPIHRPSTPYRSTTLTRPSSLVSRPAINRVGTYGTTRFDRHVAWWPNMHNDRHDHHVIVVGGDGYDGSTSSAVTAIVVAIALLAYIAAYKRRRF